MAEKIPKAFLARVKTIKAKRAKTVISHIIEHGSVTTEELKDKYGYNHPPRAVRDVKEQGIPIEMFKTVGKDGRSIAAYRFDLTAAIEEAKSGRKPISKATKEALIVRDGSRCAVCGQKYESRYLQVDHCVPYEVAGESLSDDLDELMLVCGSCNRGKSWSCEHCENWTKTKDIRACRSCYWVNPRDYRHMALVEIRRVDLSWKGDEVKAHDKMRDTSKALEIPLQELIKRILTDSSRVK